MKKIYQNSLSASLAKSLFFSALLIGVFYGSSAQVYRANHLSGPNEAPPNASPGTGYAIVTIEGTNMRVQAAFNGLIGTTTASHIHAPTDVAGVGTAGVATTTPYFPGFPLGVTSGTYDMTFDMTLASSYRAGYITANGGTTATAFAALRAALNDGTSYFNIHTTAFPGGEIRGFLVACPTISVTIPDVFALPQGVLPNTVYPAYAPAASLTLSTNIMGGTGPYTYNWSNGSTASTITASPVVATAYSVTVADQNGCTGEAAKTVNVANIAGGKNGDKIVLCHKNGRSLTIDGSDVADHLGHGDQLGGCPESTPSVVSLSKSVGTEITTEFSVLALPNPSTTYFDLKISGKAGTNVQVLVYDLMGRAVEIKHSVQPNQTLRLGSSYAPGIYLLKITQGSQKQTLKLLKVK